MTYAQSCRASPLFSQGWVVGVADRAAAKESVAVGSCLGLVKSSTWTLLDGEESVAVGVGSRFAINSVGLMRRMATLDMGILLLPDEIVADDVAAGRLQRVLPQWHGKPTPVYALTETRLVPAKTQRFIEFLRQRLAPAA